MKNQNITMKNDVNQIAMLLVMVIAGVLTLSDEQINAIRTIILGAISTPANGMTDTSVPVQDVGETICGMAEFARFLGTSVPTACKISRSGKFDAARLNFGTRKFVWDKTKLLELAKNDK